MRTLCVCLMAAMALGLPARAQQKPPGSVTLSEPGSAALSPRYFGLTVLEYERYRAEFPYGTTRSWDSYPGLGWPEMSRVRGRYDFHWLDEYLAQAGARGREVIYTFGRTPRWASTMPDRAGAYQPGECGPPDLAAWDEFVTAIVKHAHGRVRYWELWNEPDKPTFYCGDIPTMVPVAQHAAAIIRKLDPAALILSPAATGGDGAGWLAKFVAAGGRDTFDVVAFHGYEGVHAEAILPIVAVYRNVLHAFKMPDLPLIDTECSWGANPIGDDSHRAAFVSKYLVLQWSANVARVIWYAYDGEPKWGRLIDAQGKLLPDGVAYAETEKWISGATLTRPCAKDASGTWTCSLSRPGGYQAAIVWNSDVANPVPVKVPAGLVAIRDLAGGRRAIAGGLVPVGNEPVLMESGGAR